MKAKCKNNLPLTLVGGGYGAHLNFSYIFDGLHISGWRLFTLQLTDGKRNVILVIECQPKYLITIQAMRSRFVLRLPILTARLPIASKLGRMS
jgi:hypothetical protein